MTWGGVQVSPPPQEEARRFEKQTGCTSPSEEAILVWDQLEWVGKRNLGVATFLSWQVNLLQRLSPFLQETARVPVQTCDAKLHRNVVSVGPVVWTDPCAAPTGEVLFGMDLNKHTCLYLWPEGMAVL